MDSTRKTAAGSPTGAVGFLMRPVLVTLCALAGALAGCAAGVGPSASATGGTAAGGIGGDGGTGGAGGTWVPDPNATTIPARVRRLTNAEYDRSVAVLLGTATRPAAAFTKDSRQSGFTMNADQRVDGILADQLKTSAETLAHEAVTMRLAALVPCAAAATEACAGTFIDAFGRRAFRRPVDAAERSALLDVFRVGIDGGTFAEGIELVITAILQSPAFLYLTELGASNASGATVTLTDHEIAAGLSYLLTAGPPDDALVAAADAASLQAGAARATQAQRLLADAAAHSQMQRLIEEWLAIEQLDGTAKDAAVYPSFQGLRPAMLDEANNFIDEVLYRDEGTLGRLLGADYTVASPAMATFYGLTGGGAGRLALGTSRRRGILNQAAFLSVHAHGDGSAPVKRGAIIRRKLFCQQLMVPTDPAIVVVFPPPDPTRTTRERYQAHVSNIQCSGCHTLIDPIGFAFEAFDGMGGQRQGLLDNGKPVDTTGVLSGTDVDGPIADSVDLATKLASSAAVRSCFANNVLRFASAQSIDGVEKEFLKVVAGLPPAGQGKLLDLLVAYSQSDLFIKRRVP